MRFIRLYIYCGLALLMVCAVRSKAQQPPPDFNVVTRQAVQKSLPLLQSGAAGFLAKTKCISCHNQSLPQMALGLAQARGFKVDVILMAQQDKSVYGASLQLKGLLQAATKSKDAEKQLDILAVDPSITIGYMMTGMAAGKQKPDELTGLMAQYVARKQQANGAWPTNAARPPMEGSEFAATALTVRALKAYAPEDPETPTRIAKARTWFLDAPPHTTEDRTFRLLGLFWTGAEAADIAKAREDLASLQHDDGGWGQLPVLASDAYATGQALVALHEAGSMPVTDSVYQRGRFFLLNTQAQDGSWFVPKRAISVQPYVEAGYPYKNAQFISIAGACWATMALLYSIEPLRAAPVRSAAAAPVPQTGLKTQRVIALQSSKTQAPPAILNSGR